MIKKKPEQQLAKPIVSHKYSQLPPDRINVVTAAARQATTDRETAKANFTTIPARPDSISWSCRSGFLTCLAALFNQLMKQAAAPKMIIAGNSSGFMASDSIGGVK